MSQTDPQPHLSGPSERERSARRWNLIYKAAGFSVLGRIISVACVLAQVPVALHHLGKEAFGLWMTLTGTVGLLAFADLGIGLGMQNKISTASGKDDMKLAQDVFLTGFVLLGAVAAALFAIALMLIGTVDWVNLFKIESPELRPQVNQGLIVVFAAFCLGFPLSAAQKLAVALQLGWLQSIAGVIGSVLSLILISVAAWMKLSFVPFLAVALMPPVLVNLWLLWRLFAHLKWRFDPLKHASLQHVREIFGTGTLFLLPQLGSSIVLSAPAVILSSVLGAAAVVPFNLAQRLLGVISQIQGMLIAPLWPAYAEAKSRGDGTWIRQAFRRSLLYTAISGVVPCVLFAFLGRPLILLWTGQPESLPSQELLWLMCAFTIAAAAGAPCAVFLNGMGRLFGQATYGSVTALISLILMPVLAQRYGAAGIPAALILAYVPINLVLAYLECWHELRRVRRGPLQYAPTQAPEPKQTY